MLRINKALKTSDCLVCPLGSAHICGADAPTEQRLGTLFLSDTGIDLNLANFYQKGSDASNFVNKDIETFKIQHPSYKNEVIYQALSNKEILEKQPIKLKLKPNVPLKKPVKINKQSDASEEIQNKTEPPTQGSLKRKLSQEDITTETGPPTKILKTKLSTDITTETREEAKKIRKDFKLEKYSPDVQKLIILKRKKALIKGALLDR